VHINQINETEACLWPILLIIVRGPPQAPGLTLN
jgi:hypothetical protein